MSDEQSDHEWRWSRPGVEQRIRAMSPADAILTVELYNARHSDDASKRLHADAYLRGLTLSEAEEVRMKVATFRQSASGWGHRYWAERLRENRAGTGAAGDDSAIMAEMAAAHPGFSAESLRAVYHFGLMLTR